MSCLRKYTYSRACTCGWFSKVTLLYSFRIFSIFVWGHPSFFKKSVDDLAHAHWFMVIWDHTCHLLLTFSLGRALFIYYSTCLRPTYASWKLYLLFEDFTWLLQCTGHTCHVWDSCIAFMRGQFPLEDYGGHTCHSFMVIHVTFGHIWHGPKAIFSLFAPPHWDLSWDLCMWPKPQIFYVFFTMSISCSWRILVLAIV